MARGGHPNSGPLPDPMALRRDRTKDSAGWTLLPAKGRPGKPPAWPLSEASPRESQLWVKLWASPQAAAWDDLGSALSVALYVRLVVLGEQGKVTAVVEARQWSDRL